ncbi:MAG: DNA mismatch repair protein MutS [Chitinophagales bacterium]|nr:DNA mismatch repair protein MutS [Chitinophagales bacterium]
MSVVETPLMKQYNQIKGKYPDAILLFRVGDFYETFGTDAITASKILGITLTKRANGAATHIELAGFPHHSLDTYLPKLVKAGYRVAICDQLEDPKKTKTIVKRGVTELVTPGVNSNDHILDSNKNNYLASLFFDKDEIGIAFIDISTGEFIISKGNASYIDKLLQSFKPAEIIYPKRNQKEFQELFGTKFFCFSIDDWVYTQEYTTELLLKQFETISLKGFGIMQYDVATFAAGAALYYLGQTEHNRTQHISKINLLEGHQHVWLDRFTIRNLELLFSPNENAKTLCDVIDMTQTPMGSRLIRKWIILPLKDIAAIEARHSVVADFVLDDSLANTLIQYIKPIGDIERLISKVSLGKINPREVIQIKRSLSCIEPIKNLLAESKNPVLLKYGELLNACQQLIHKIENEIMEDAPVAVNKGNVFREGVHFELDELKNITQKGKDYILSIQQKEIEATGISSLKVGFNNVFGYYLEVTNLHKNKVPDTWMRKQTLTNAERYITEELKVYEQKVLTAEEKILQIEEELFQKMIVYIHDYIAPIQFNANIIGELDCLLSFCLASVKNNYVKPIIDQSLVIDIKDGRHPVIEQLLEIGDAYVPNDVYLNSEEQQIMMITGPNMSGKSAVLRQTALIVLMAQIGCFVPAASAKIGIVDKIFTRVGASDNISSGESTFMVEMNETASIINNISERSLILLDEIGRGTSTYDGISIAWSLAEYLHYCDAKPKTLFATHYHELNELAPKFSRIKNYHISTREMKNKVIFLRKLVEGGSEHSFGIHVAKMAGMPKEIVDRANAILADLEEKAALQNNKDSLKNLPKNTNLQLSIFDTTDPMVRQIQAELDKMNVDKLTPIEALMKLSEWKRMLKGG